MREDIIRSVEAVVHWLLAGNMLVREEDVALIALYVGASAYQPDRRVSFPAGRGDERQSLHQHAVGIYQLNEPVQWVSLSVLISRPPCRMRRFSTVSWSH